MDRPLKLMHLVGTATGGEWFLRQVSELHDRGHEVLAVVPDSGSVHTGLERAGIPTRIVRFKGSRIGDLPRIAAAQVSLIGLVRSFRPDIVHAHLFKAILMGRIAARLGGSQLVSQWPGDVHFDAPLLHSLDRVTLRLDTATLASNEALAARYRALGARHVAVAYYGLPVASWDPDLPGRQAEADRTRSDLHIGPGTAIVTMVAHMYPTRIEAFQQIGVKGHEVFIDAAARLLRVGRRACFLIVGDELAGTGEYRRALEARAERLGLSGGIRFLGHRDDIDRLMVASDVVVVPSIRESASYAAIQALLLRRPVVASRVGGLPDTVQNGETGFLVAPGDAVDLAAAIECLLDSPSLRNRMGRLGRERALTRFDIATTVDQVEAVYHRIVWGIERDA